MKKFLLAPLLALLLTAACAPTATVAEPDDQALRFVETPQYNLVIVADAPIEYGEIVIAGLELVIESEFCALPDCAPDEAGYVRITYPDEPNEAYPQRLEIDVLDGVVIRGRALFSLQGETVSRPALLQVRP